MKKGKLIFSAILVLGIVLSYAQDDYAEFNGWSFRNWDQETVWWDIFERAFIGITTDDLFDALLYNEVYSTNATGGQCFGMSLLSITCFNEEGHLGFCKPIYIYSGDNVDPYTGPEDSLLRKAIMIMHAHQFGHACVNWLAQIMTGGDYRDAKYAYDQVQYYLSMDDPPLISVIQSFGTGHAMVPLWCEEKGSTEWRIYLYDPNRPYITDSNYYDLDSNYIKIETATVGYKWSFVRDDGDIWTGDALYGGIFATPSSLVIPPSRNPLELGAIVDDLGLIIFASDGGSIAQITDEQGRRFYKTDAEIHTRLSEIEDDPNSGMTNTIRWIRFADTDEDYPEVYYVKKVSGKDLIIDVASKGNDYKFHLAGADNLVKIEAMSGSRGRDQLTVQKVGTGSQELTIKTKRGATTFSIELYRPLSAFPKAARTFKVSNLKVSTASPVQLRLTENLDALLLKSEKEPVVCDLEITQTIGTEISKLEKKNVNVSGLKWQKISPSNWANLMDAKVDIEKIEFKKVLVPEE